MLPCAGGSRASLEALASGRPRRTGRSAEVRAAVKPIGRDFLVVLDWRYLPRAIALYRSLAAVSPSFRLRVYCMDEATERILGKLALPGLDVIGLGEPEADVPELRAVR